jgi:hypothetical protein
MVAAQVELTAERTEAAVRVEEATVAALAAEARVTADHILKVAGVDRLLP